MKNFSELDLIAPLKLAIEAEGYQQPTPIQARALPPALAGRDVLGIAQTGTGKTAAFALPILNDLGSENRKSRAYRPLALILAPTRELAIQIGESLATYGQHLRLRISTIYGGVGQNPQVKQLRRGSHILVATPGRLLDLMNQGFVHLEQLETFVLDEADRMLDMGFLPDLKRILRALPKDRQSLFFSATLPPSIKSLASDLLSDPVSVHVAPHSISVDAIEQRFFLLQKQEKQPLLAQLLMGTEVDRAIVFTKTKRGANRLAEHLAKMRIRAVTIHGNKSQAARQKALEAFKARKASVLVATDVAARGIDIPGVSHVINFDLPDEPESYVHRIGRTGRAGAEGVAITFCLPEERRELRAIEKLLGKRFPITRGPAGVEFARGKQSPGGHPNTRRRRRRSAEAGKAGGGQARRQRRRGTQAAESGAGAETAKPPKSRDRADRSQEQQQPSETKVRGGKRGHGANAAKKRRRRRPSKRALPMS